MQRQRRFTTLGQSCSISDIERLFRRGSFIQQKLPVHLAVGNYINKPKMSNLEEAELQLSELDLLSSMFPNEGDFKVTDQLALAELKDYAGKCTLEVPSSKIQFILYLDVETPGENKVPFSLCCAFPLKYPTILPEITIRSPLLSRSQQVQMNADLITYLKKHCAGPQEMCEEFWARIRRLSWQRILIRHREDISIEGTEANMEKEKKFLTFEEKIFDAHDGVAGAIMGGKNKQRTKGNVRPSSSGRTAELLAKEQGTVPGFVGFGTSSSDLGYIPAIQGAEEIDTLIDADFRMVLRKLSKRDVITKLKAMQEFGVMCKERETEIVKGVLPYWPRIYCKISLDHDRRVREATQQAFEQLILKVRKHLAPHLKNIMGYWLIAQCDIYSPAASAAKEAFEKAFPPSKQSEALVFCKDEILNVLQDHLLKETPDTLSDPQTVPEEEREAKFHRVITSSLLSLKKLLCMMPNNEIKSLEERLKTLLSQNKFWKYGKDNIAQVRSAFFEVITTFCQHIPESMNAEASRVCPAVLLSIDDSDAIVCLALWEAVLHVLSTIQDCWSHVNAKKGVLPKLWTVLREGGRGLATIIYPNILPFISKVPHNVADPKLNYSTIFFTSIINGLFTERAMVCRSESSAIISTFMECLQFTVLQNIGEEEEQVKIQEMLINIQLIPLIDTVIKEPNSPIERENILNDLTKMNLKWSILLQIIQKACSSSEKHSLSSTWLKGDVLGEKLVTLADDLCNISLKMTVTSAESFHSEQWTLLSLVLSQLIKNESLIGEVYVKRIIDKLQAALSKAKDLSEAGNTELSVSFICDIASSFFTSVKGCLMMPSSEDLLFTIFQLCAQTQDITRLSDFLINKLKHTWMCGITSLVHQHSILHKESSFLQKSAFWVKNQLQTSVLDIKSLQVLISVVNDLLTTLLEAEDVSACVLKDYIEWLTPSQTEWEKMRESLSSEWLRKPLLEGRLSINCELPGIDNTFSIPAKLPSHLCTAALLSRMALLILEKEVVFENAEVERRKIDNIIVEQLYALQWIEELANPSDLLLEFLHDTEVMKISHENFYLLNHISHLLQILLNRSKESGQLWALTMAKLMNTKNFPPYEIKALFDSSESFFPLTEGNLHTLQSLSPFLPEEDKEELVIRFTAKLMTCNGTDLFGTEGAFGYLSILNSCLNTQDTDYGELMVGILKVMVSWRDDYEDSFLFSCNLQEANPQLLGLNIEMIRFISLLLKKPLSLLENEWDFVMCSMLAWLETTCENPEVFPAAQVQVFASVSCDLSASLSAYFQAATPEIVEEFPDNLMSECQDFFSEGIHSLLLPLLAKITRKEQDAMEISFQNSLVKSLGKALIYISKDQLLNHRLPAKFVAVYHMLNKLMSDLPKFDNVDLRSYGDEEEELLLSPPAALMTVLTTQEDLLENILECIPVGEFAEIQPMSDEFCLILGYLLTWKLILSFFKGASSQLRALYSQYLRRTKSLNKLLYHLFRLMPENPTFPGSTSELLHKDIKTYFTEELDLDIKDTQAMSSHIPHLACTVYCMTLKDLPAMVRLWWNSCEKRVFNIVDKFTSKYVSGILSSQEISSVQTSTQLFNGMMVKARSATREVIATYSVDDIFIELIIQLPPNYPLGSIAVESGKRVGVAVQQWRNWMLQLSTYLTHQNGSIMEGLALWKNNVDKRFEGVEDCMICFSVIHGSNYSLPKKACRTCKKKFHSACLYKWFTSSNKSTCPLCRENFF
ncbi:E3 ubiquitin-protein ligase listerin [Crotalus adamanteus]|uniref:E3 ubiquitin-protein ligase listerin n=1 Tax=Crotalus adamanteus TaxID=8729 RepID=A0AAW1BJC2_CROAD